jgi:hypothetical protein
VSWARASIHQAALAVLATLAVPIVFGAAGCSKGQIQEVTPPAIKAAEPGGLADRALAATVKMNLTSDPRTQSSNINVRVMARVVTLSGQVASADVKAAALQIAQRSAGGREIVDQMTVAPGAPPAGGAGGLPGGMGGDQGAPGQSSGSGAGGGISPP